MTTIIIMIIIMSRNMAPRAGIEATSLAFHSVITITPLKLPDITTRPAPTCLCGSWPERSVQTISKVTKSMLTITDSTIVEETKDIH